MDVLFEESGYDSGRMTPVEFERMTGVSWNRILRIARNYGESGSSDYRMAAAVNTEYMPSSSVMVGILRQLQSISALSGHIFEVLCLIYFGFRYGGAVVGKDEFENPEYDIYAGNRLIQCKWTSHPAEANFGSIHKDYGSYKGKYSFCAVIGCNGGVEYISALDRRYLQLGANFAALLKEVKTDGMSAGELYKKLADYGITEIRGGKKFLSARSDKVLSKEEILGRVRKLGAELDAGGGRIRNGELLAVAKEVLGRNIHGKVDLSVLANKDGELMAKGGSGKTAGVFKLKVEYLRKIGKEDERLDMAKSVRKFVEYFENDRQLHSDIRDEMKKMDDKKKELNSNARNESKSEEKLRMNRLGKIGSIKKQYNDLAMKTLGKNREPQNTVKDTVRQMHFGY